MKCSVDLRKLNSVGFTPSEPFAEFILNEVKGSGQAKFYLVDEFLYIPSRNLRQLKGKSHQKHQNMYYI